MTDSQTGMERFYKNFLRFNIKGFDGREDEGE
jgi:hypothetical protein